MIGYLHGKIFSKSSSEIILLVGGVGYLVFTAFNNSSLIKGEEASLLIYTEVKENDIRLFGFEDELSKDIFLQVISVNGIGTKVASSLLSSIGSKRLLQAVLNEDKNIIQIKGIGKKTAEKLIFSLKEKFEQFRHQISNTEESSPKQAEIVEAVMSLGYSGNEVYDVIENLDLSDLSVSDGVKLVLKNLRK